MKEDLRKRASFLLSRVWSKNSPRRRGRRESDQLVKVFNQQNTRLRRIFTAMLNALALR